MFGDCFGMVWGWFGCNLRSFSVVLWSFWVRLRCGLLNNLLQGSFSRWLFTVCKALFEVLKMRIFWNFSVGAFRDGG